MSLLRCEPMLLTQMILAKDAAYDCVAQLGRLGVVQFNDLNQSKPILQRYFVRDTRRSEETERKLRFIRRQVLECSPTIEIPSAPIGPGIEVPHQAEIHQLDARLDELERNFLELNKNESRLRKNLNELKEIQFVLQRVEQFFEVHMDDEAMMEIHAAEADADSDGFSKSFASGYTTYNTLNDVPLTPLLSDAERGENAWFVAGVLPFDKSNTFERVLWRACRRTAFVRISDIRLTLEDPETLDPVSKCVFIVFFKGENLKQIVSKVCDGFNARQYPCPKTSRERQTALFETITRIQDLSIIIDSSTRHRYDILSKLTPDLPLWFQKIRTQKAIYQTLNMCTVDTNDFLAAECWIPKSEMQHVELALHEGMKVSGSDVSPVVNVLASNRNPPTFHRTNKFTKVFQGIVDSYGIASYREVNPAIFTIITFPFLFAVMFGDAGHGTILFLAGLFFIMYEDSITKSRIRDEIFNTFFGGRYIIILMGIFSIYTGFIYNDLFAKSLDIFGSRWANPYNITEMHGWLFASWASGKGMLLTLDPKTAYMSKDGPYPFGVDPIWNIAENRLSFLNSMKMKASVILGVGQMAFGVLLSFLNYRFFHSRVDTLTNFLPQLIFLVSIFVYLCLQIIVKWIFFGAEAVEVLGQEYPGPVCAPSLLIGLINMFMLRERPEGFMQTDGTHHPSCYLNQWYPYQSLVEKCLLTTAVLTIPIMLIGKPLVAWLDSSKKHAPLNGKDDGNHTGPSPAGHQSLSDLIVHQAIHTIEFVLGCVSHTASYLRLWALSLAHAQLSEVLWHMVLMAGLGITEEYIPGGIVAYIIFFIFAVMSFSILILMEGLSAFLHALRLHWVEFQSKFYQGTGHAFRPFSIVESLEIAEQELGATDDLN